MTFDPIPALQAFGYTDREAAFLYLVAAHSGYFLRRQFDYFVDRNKGSIVMRFLAKARAAGHVEVLDYDQGWHVYHLCARTLYRLAGDSESTLRRRKGDAQMRIRLMTLDYVLENEADHYLPSEAERVHYFRTIRRVPPHTFEDDLGRLPFLLSAFPVSILDKEHPALSLVRFAFIDEGLAEPGKFLRFLDVAEPLLREIGAFEVVYISNSESIFHLVKAAFWSRFSEDVPHSLSLFDGRREDVSRAYHRPLQASFTTLLFKHSYPSFRRSKVKGSEGVRSGLGKEAAK